MLPQNNKKTKINNHSDLGLRVAAYILHFWGQLLSSDYQTQAKRTTCMEKQALWAHKWAHKCAPCSCEIAWAPIQMSIYNWDKKKTKGEEFWRWECEEINISTHPAAQQSIDDIQMSHSWSVCQCGISMLHFFYHQITKVFSQIQNHIRKTKHGKRILEMGCDEIKQFSLTPLCKLTSMSLQSNSRLTTSKCPFPEACISAVNPEACISAVNTRPCIFLSSITKSF